MEVGRGEMVAAGPGEEVIGEEGASLEGELELLGCLEEGALFEGGTADEEAVFESDVGGDWFGVAGEGEDASASS